MQISPSLRKNIKTWILIIIAALAISGFTVFALEMELAWLSSLMPDKECTPAK